VVLGVIFLLNNLGHEIPFWRYIWDYWPFLLIGLGVIRLAEVLFHVSRGATPPHSGSAIFWIVLTVICFAFWSTRNVVHLGNWNNPGTTIGMLGSSFDYNVSVNSGSEGVTRLVLDNINGDLTVRGSDGGNVEVTGHKTVRAFSRNDADRTDRETAVRLERQGDSLVLHADQQARAGIRSVSTDLDIMVPRGVNVEARSQGDLDIEDMAGMVTVTDSRGDVRLNNIAKDVRVTARGGMVRTAGVKGSVDLQGRGGDVQMENVEGPVTINGEFSGTLEFHGLSRPMHFQSSRSDFQVEQVPGSITMDLGDLKLDNVVGPVKFRTGSRDIDITDVTNSLELNIDRGDIEVEASKAPLPKMDVHTRNGDVTLTLPGGAGFDLDGKTNNGEADNGFGAPLDTRNDGKSATIKGHAGNGPHLAIVTDRGTLAVKKK
jgi:DUF4097 and DUF4098 domain-containing protein YvlB